MNSLPCRPNASATRGHWAYSHLGPVHCGDHHIQHGWRNMLTVHCFIPNNAVSVFSSSTYLFRRLESSGVPVVGVVSGILTPLSDRRWKITYVLLLACIHSHSTHENTTHRPLRVSRLRIGASRAQYGRYPVVQLSQRIRSPANFSRTNNKNFSRVCLKFFLYVCTRAITVFTLC